MKNLSISRVTLSVVTEHTSFKRRITLI